jgi:CRISPR/Cas system-associated endoribonuclease Cas2
MAEFKKWFLVFYDIKGSKAFAKSTFRSKISREFAKTRILPLQQSVWAIEASAENRGTLERITQILKANNAKVLLFEGNPIDPSTNDDVVEMIGVLVDRKYENVKEMILNLKTEVKKTENKDKRKPEFSHGALKLRRKFDKIVSIDPREMISNTRSVTEGEFFSLEKEINEIA